MKAPQVRIVHAAAQTLGLPVRLIVRGIARVFPQRAASRVLNHKAGQIVVGVIVVFTGSGLASIQQAFVPHFIWDGFAYTIHGLGCAPLIEHSLQFLARFVSTEQ